MDLIFPMQWEVQEMNYEPTQRGTKLFKKEKLDAYIIEELQ